LLGFAKALALAWHDKLLVHETTDKRLLASLNQKIQRYRRKHQPASTGYGAD